MLLGFRPERAFSLAEIPHLPLRERFKPQSARRSVRTGSGLPQRWYEWTERTPRPRFDYTAASPSGDDPTSA